MGWDEIDNAPMPGGGRFMNDGRYRVRIEAFKAGKSQQGKGEYYVAEMTVLDVIMGYENSNPAGERLSWVQFKSWQPSASNIKGFIKALTGLDDDDGAYLIAPDGKKMKFSEALDKATAGDGTAFAGAELIAEAMSVKTKKGGDFTKVLWTAAEDPE